MLPSCIALSLLDASLHLHPFPISPNSFSADPPPETLLPAHLSAKLTTEPNNILQGVRKRAQTHPVMSPRKGAVSSKLEGSPTTVTTTTATASPGVQVVKITNHDDEEAASTTIPSIGRTPSPRRIQQHHGPRPSPRFGAHTAWKHFFQIMALGGGPVPGHTQHEPSQSAQHQHQHQHDIMKTLDDQTTITTATEVPSTRDDALVQPQPYRDLTNSDLPLLKESTHRHIERIFAGLRGRAGDYITRETLEEFLKETQGGLVRPLDKDIYTLGDFVYVWLHDYSAALRPVVKKDLSRPITNYFISSSHNTYIGLGNQLNGEVSADAYRTVLEGDCRCVEIDVWNGEGWSERSATPTPSRSKSPGRSEAGLPAQTNGLKGGHKRHLSNLSTLSTSSLPAAAQSLIDAMDEKWRELTGNSSKRREEKQKQKQKHGVPRYGNTSASMSSLHLTLPPASQSTTWLDRNDLLAPNDIYMDGAPLRNVKSAESLRSRISRKARSQSPSHSRSRSRSREPRGRTQHRRIEPEVTHAHTVQGLGDVGLARRIPLREVCKVIRQSAFKTNKLPIIVSLEVHATGEQQDMMVDIMKEEWGDHLLDERLEGCNPDERQPRLEELLCKILVKVKKPNATSGLGKGLSQLTVPILHHHDDGSESDLDEVIDSQPSQTGSSSVSTSKKSSTKTKIGEALGRLAIYTHSEHYKDFTAASAQTLSHIFSIDEYKILKLHQTRHRELFIHNQRFFMRAYPHSTRVNSTNLDPSLYWRKGVQMVALNWQRAHVDEAMMLNSAMFESEGGWVLKPEGYRGGDSEDTQAAVSKARRRTLQRLTITVLAAQLLPIPDGDDGDAADGSKSMASSVSTAATSDDLSPLVKCELHVETNEERNEKKAIKSGLVQDGLHKLVTKCAETDNPDWGNDGQVLEFPPIDFLIEELSFVR